MKSLDIVICKPAIQQSKEEAMLPVAFWVNELFRGTEGNCAHNDVLTAY
jgi:hypothetical protein